MRWGDFRRSNNVDDREGQAPGGGGFPGGGGVRLSGGAILLVVIASWLFGVNPLEILGILDGGPAMQPSGSTGQSPRDPVQAAPGYGPQRAPSASASGGQSPRPQDGSKDMVARVLGDTEDVWTAVFKSMGMSYESPRLVLYRGAVQSACGRASAAVGPFYCPGDHKLYLDRTFFNDLDRRFGAPGDFAQAYVIAHEVGHHVQNLTGVMRQFDLQSSRIDRTQRNALSVRLELQADCLAGVWGHFAQRRNLLDPGDIDEGMRAASAVGDDMIQKQAQGHVTPDSFTHGSAEQRARWFRTGLQTGDMRACNAFAAR